MDLATRLAQFPREQLALTPTPLDPLPHLSRRLGPRVSLKRDDLTGLALGGDKPRKLEYELAYAREQGADFVVTCGSMQSNHARLTSAAARKLGMDCAVVLSRDSYDEFQGNLLTVRLLGAEVLVFDVDDHWALEPHAQRMCDSLRSAGRRPHYVPISGTTPRSCLGYVRAGLELASQLGEVDAIYLPFGTGGIFTGIVRALRDQGVTAPAIGISVNRNTDACWESYAHWWHATGDLLDYPRTDPPTEGIEIHDEHVGPEYGYPTTECLDAILLFARTEGIFLDPVYSGKMAAGFLAHQAAGRWTADHQVVLLHSGGVPALFAYHEALRDHLARGEKA